MADRAGVLREEYPAFWDDETETFIEPVSTNAIEDGNWQLKYGLRTLYTRCQGALARTALASRLNVYSRMVTLKQVLPTVSATSGTRL